MATKIAVSGPRFVAPDDMADVEFNAPSWDDVEPSADDLLAPLPAEELEYFERMKVRRAERESAKRAKRTATRATVPSEFRIMADVAHRLTVEGATPPVVSMARDSAPVMTTGYRTHVELVTVAGDMFTVYGTTSVAEQYAGTAHAITDDRMARVPLDGDLYGTVRRVAPRRTANRRRSSVTVETGKESRGKWVRNQASMARHESNRDKELLRNEQQRRMFAARAEIERKLAAGEPVANSEWKAALGRSLTVTEMKATKRQRDAASAGYASGTVETYGGKESAMSRMLNSIGRK